MKNQSLQDQLLKAGLSNETKAKQVRAEKRKQTQKQRKNKVAIVDETKQNVAEKKAKLVEQDRLLNEERNKQAENKQIINQIFQLIELNKLSQNNEEGIAYNFTDQNKVKIIYIDDECRSNIIKGKLAIVKSKSNYEVVPANVAKKIQQRNEKIIIVLFSEQSDEGIDNDDYQGFEIPDDLMW